MGVYLIAKPRIDWEMLDTYLEHLGFTTPELWCPTEFSDAEILCEVMGRICYRSFAPGLNPNVTKVRDKDYLKNVVKSGHGSVLEHAQVSWIFKDVTRVLTHELVRHRVGTAISQESLRYVRLSDMSVPVPECIATNEGAYTLYTDTVNLLKEAQKKLAQIYDIDGLPFKDKKVLTSAFRRIAPIGVATTIGWSCNLRTLRHVIELRTSPHAEEEIRKLFTEVYRISKEEFPSVFDDFTIDADGWCKGAYKC